MRPPSLPLPMRSMLLPAAGLCDAVNTNSLKCQPTRQPDRVRVPQRTPQATHHSSSSTRELILQGRLILHARISSQAVRVKQPRELVIHAL